MAAANTDKFKKVASNTGWQLDASGISDAVVDNFGLVSANGLPTGTGVKITIDRVDSSGASTPAKMERIDGVVSGDTIISCVRGVEGTAQAHSGGAVVEIMISADLWNDVMDAMVAEHGQDGLHKQPSTNKASITDNDTFGLFDSVASFIFKNITFLTLKLALYVGIKPAEGTMWNGKIVVTDTGTGLKVDLKTLSGADPSATDVTYITLDGVVRAITYAVSQTRVDGGNWFNAGSAELATKEIDYFTYLGYSTSTNKVELCFARISYATLISDFSATGTNEKFASGYTSFNTTDTVQVIGRFAATLSAGAGYTWSIPTYTTKNLIQKPIYETRKLSCNLITTGFTGAVSGSISYKYNYDIASVFITTIQGTSNATGFTFNLPFTSANAFTVPCRVKDSVGTDVIAMHILSGSSTTVYSTGAGATWTASGTKNCQNHSFLVTLV